MFHYKISRRILLFIRVRAITFKWIFFKKKLISSVSIFSIRKTYYHLYIYICFEFSKSLILSFLPNICLMCLFNCKGEDLFVERKWTNIKKWSFLKTRFWKFFKLLKYTTRHTWYGCIKFNINFIVVFFSLKIHRNREVIYRLFFSNYRIISLQIGTYVWVIYYFLMRLTVHTYYALLHKHNYTRVLCTIISQ